MTEQERMRIKLKAQARLRLQQQQPIDFSLPDAPIQAGSMPIESNMEAGVRQRYEGANMLEQLPMAARDMAFTGINGLTLGQAPKLRALGRSALFGENYDDALKESQGMMDEAQYGAGVPGMVNESLGMGKTALGLMGKGVTAMRPLANIRGGNFIGGVLDNAALGALYNSGQGDSATTGAITGAIGGAAGNLLGAGVSKLAGSAKDAYKRLTGAATKFTPKTSDELFDLASSQYKRADDAGLQFTPQAYENIADDLAITAGQRGIGGPLAKVTDQIYPKSKSLVEALQDRKGVVPSLQDMAMTKRVAFKGGKGFDADSELMRELGGMINRSTKNAATSDFLPNPNVDAGIKALKEADILWGKGAKTSRVENLLESSLNAQGANYTQAGKLTAIKQKFRNIADSKEFAREWSKPEQEAILKIVRGSNFEKALRLASKFSPRGAITGGMAITALMANPVATVPALAIAEGSKFASTKIGQRNVNKLLEVLQSGPSKKGLTPSQNEKIKDIIRKLSVASVPAQLNQ